VRIGDGAGQRTVGEPFSDPDLDVACATARPRLRIIIGYSTPVPEPEAPEGPCSATIVAPWSSLSAFFRSSPSRSSAFPCRREFRYVKTRAATPTPRESQATTMAANQRTADCEVEDPGRKNGPAAWLGRSGRRFIVAISRIADLMRCRRRPALSLQRLASPKLRAYSTGDGGDGAYHEEPDVGTENEPPRHIERLAERLGSLERAHASEPRTSGGTAETRWSKMTFLGTDFGDRFRW